MGERAPMRTWRWEQDTPRAHDVGSSPSNWSESCPRLWRFPQGSPGGLLNSDALPRPKVWRWCSISLRWNGRPSTFMQRIPQTRFQQPSTCERCEFIDWIKPFVVPQRWGQALGQWFSTRGSWTSSIWSPWTSYKCRFSSPAETLQVRPEILRQAKIWEPGARPNEKCIYTEVNTD